jgi:hypothetical protein
MATEVRKPKMWACNDTSVIEDLKEVTVDKNNLVQILLSLKESDITYTFMMNLFGDFGGTHLCAPYDLIEVPAGRYTYKNSKGKEVSNKNKFTTTIGIWVFNVYFLRDDGIAHLFSYLNEPVGKKLFGRINQTMSYALLEDKITIEQHKRYLEKTQWIMPFETVLAPNHSEKMLTCTKAIDKKKRELYKKYKADIDAGKVDVAEKMEKELLAFAEEYMGDDPGMDMFTSGGGGSFENNFKNLYIMKGPIKDPDPNAKQEYNVALSNYCDGISADEYTLIANSLAAGPYSRGKKTETGGYWEKLFVSSLQHVVLDDPGTDCGTDKYITVTLTKKNISLYMYNYIIEGSKLVELTSDNRDKYIDKKVKMRFSSMCKRTSGKICNHCAGNLFYRIGITNIGVATSQIASTLKNICMKAFHDGTVSTTEIDPMHAFSIKD